MSWLDVVNNDTHYANSAGKIAAAAQKRAVHPTAEVSTPQTQARTLYQERRPILPTVEDGRAVSKPALSEARIENTVKNDPQYAAHVAAGQMSPENYVKATQAYETVDTGGGAINVSDYDYADLMTNDQLRTYDYLLSKYGKTRAKAYFNAIKATNKGAANAKADADVAQIAHGGGVRGTGFTLNTNLATLGAAPAALGQAALSAVTNTPLDHDSTLQRGMRNANVTRQAWGEGRGNIGNFVMDQGISIGQSALGAGISALTGKGDTGATLLAINAAAQKAYENAENGLSPRRGFASAALAGAAEYVGEKLSIGNFLKATDAGNVTWKQIAKSIGKQTGVEMSEEAFTEIMNNLSDEFVLGDKSEVMQYYNSLIAQGKSKNAAAAQTIGVYFGLNPLKAAAAAIPSGLLFGVGGAVTSNYNAAQLGQEIRSSGSIDSTVTAAQEGRLGGRAQTAADKYMQGKTDAAELSDRQIGGLYQMGQEYLDEAVKEARKNQKKADQRNARLELAADRARSATSTAARAVRDYRVSANFDDNTGGINIRFTPRNDFQTQVQSTVPEGTTEVRNYQPDPTAKVISQSRWNTATDAQENAQAAKTSTGVQGVPRYDSTITERQRAAINEANKQLGDGAIYNASKTAQGAEQRAAAELAARFGLDAVFFDSDAARGFNNKSTIYINRAETGAALRQIADHEIYHSFTAEDKAAIDELLKQSRPLGDEGAQYQSLYDALKARYDARTGREHTPEEVREEFAANVYSELMSNEAFRERITQENPTLMSKIVNAIKSFIAAVRNYLATGSRYGKLEGRYLESLRDMEQFAADVERVLKKAQSRTQTNTQEQSGVRFDLSEDGADQTRTDNFKNWFGDWENDPKSASKVVNEDGTPKVVYHGSYSHFTIFDKGNKTSKAPEGSHFFTDDEDVAYSYTGYKNITDLGETAPQYQGGVYPVYLNIKNPYIVDFKGYVWNSKIPIGMDINEVAQYAKDNGYDGVIAYNIIDAGDMGNKQWDENAPVKRATDYIVFNSNQIKSATDNIGTFDPNNPDIRFALPEREQSDALADKVIELTEMSRDAEYTRDDIKADIQSVLDGLKQGGYSDNAYAAAWDKLGAIANETARYTAAENSIADDAPTMYDSYGHVRDYLRNTPIKVNVNGEFGGNKDAEALRRGHFGRVRISKSGTPIDVVYQELAEMAPDLFDANSQVSEGDQIRRIYEVADMLYDRSKRSQPLDDRQKQQMSEWVQGELFGALLEAVEGGSDAEAAQSARKQKVSQTYTNTFKRSTVLNEETDTFSQLPEEDFYYTPTTNKEQRAEAARRLDEYGMDEEMKRLSGKETFSDGGVDVYEASLITQKLARDGDVEGLREWAALTVTKVREAARTLQATDAAWEKSPTAAVQKEAQIVDEQREDADKAQPKKAKERKRKERLSSEVQKQTEEEAFDQIGKEVEEMVKKQREGKEQKEQKEGKDFDPAKDKQKRTRHTEQRQGTEKDEAEIHKRVRDRVLDDIGIKAGEKSEKRTRAEKLLDKIRRDLFGGQSWSAGAEAQKQSGVKFALPEKGWAEILKEAIEGRGEYAAVWGAARAEYLREYAGNAETIEAINEYFSTGKMPSVPISAMNRGISEAMSASDIDWKSLITDYYTKGNSTRQSVYQYIVSETGLHGKQAADLAAHIEQRYFELVEKKAHMYFEQVAVKEPKFEAGKAEANERAKLVEDRISRLFNADLKREYTERVIRTLESVYPADDENGRRRIGLIEQLIKANGIDITEIAKLGVTATDEAIDAHLREILKPLEGRITVKDRRVLRDTAYNVFAYMADVRRDQLLKKYFHIDRSTGTTEIKSVRKATKFDKITDIIRANGERRAALLEDLFREADGQPSLTQNDIVYILNVMNRAQEIEDKESYEYRRLMGLAKKAIENKQAPTRGAKAVAFRRINMLLNPRTVETRNAGSNLAMLPLNVARDYVGAGIDAAVSKMLGTDRTMARRTAEDYKRFAAGFKKGAREAVADYRNGVNTRSYTGSWDIEGREAFAPGDTVFGSQRLNDLLRKADRLTGAALDLGDRPFYEAYYADAMSQLERIYGKEEANTDEIRAIANEIALDRTWQNDTFLAEKAREVRRAFNGYSDKFYDGLSRIAGREIYGAGLGDILIPFTKTPANLTRAALQYNPAGFAVAGAHFVELTKAAKAGRPTRALQRKFVEEMTKAMTGTLLWLVGAYLAKKKVFNDDYSAEGDTYDLQKFKKEVEGIQPNSFTIGGVNFTTDWMQPIAEALTGGASYETARANGENAASALLHSAGVQATTIMNASYVKTIADFFKTLADQQNGSKSDRWKKAVLDFAKNSASQLVPLSSLVRQTGYLFDSNKRSTADVDDVRTAARSFLSGIPWAMNKLEPNLNAFGENVKRSAFSGSIGGRLFDAYLNPSSTSRVQSDSVTRELDRVYSQTGASGVIPKEVEKSVTYDGNKYKLTPKQITAYQHMVGRDIYMSLDTVMSGGTVGDVIDAKSGKLKPLLDKRYDELTDEEKAEVIAKIQSEAKKNVQTEMRADIEANARPKFTPKG